MQNYSGSLAGPTGLPIAGAGVAVYLHGTQTLATLYQGNNTNGATQTNPFTTGAGGAYSFYAQNGRYDIVITPPNQSSITISDQVLFDDCQFFPAVPNGTTVIVGGSGEQLHGILAITVQGAIYGAAGDSYAGLLMTKGAAGLTYNILDPAAVFSAIANTAGKVNFYSSGGNYLIQNNSGGTLDIMVNFLGSNGAF